MQMIALIGCVSAVVTRGEWVQIKENFADIIYENPKTTTVQPSFALSLNNMPLLENYNSVMVYPKCWFSASTCSHMRPSSCSFSGSTCISRWFSCGDRPPRPMSSVTEAITRLQAIMGRGIARTRPRDLFLKSAQKVTLLMKLTTLKIMYISCKMPMFAP